MKDCSQTQHAGRRASRRGVTVFEAKLVALAAFAVLVGLFVVTRHAAGDERESTSERDAERVFRAAEAYLEAGGAGCPTLTTLQRDGHLDRAVPVEDAWGQRFRVRCQDQKVSVRSAGADRKVGTADDVRAL